MSIVDRPASTSHDSDGTAVLKPAGALDAESSAQLSGWAQSVVDAGQPRVVIDLRDISTIDAAGLEGLVYLDGTLRRAGASIRLRSPSRRTLDLLLMTGLDRLLVYARPRDEV